MFSMTNQNHDPSKKQPLSHEEAKANVQSALAAQFRQAIVDNSSSDLNKMAAAKRVLNEHIKAMDPSNKGIAPEKTPLSEVRISPQELRAGLESLAAGISDANVADVRTHFSLLAPKEPRELIFEPHEEPLAIAFLVHGLVASDEIEKVGKVTSIGSVFADENIARFQSQFAEAGYLGGTPEEQSATFEGVKQKFSTNLEASIAGNFAAPRLAAQELNKL